MAITAAFDFYETIPRRLEANQIAGKGQRGKYICPNPNCARSFNWKGNLTRHLKYECGLQPRFKCPHCHYCCKVKGINGSFKAFGRSFIGDIDSEVRFPCPNRNCGRVFNWKRNLTRHLKYECGLQPRFKCPYCDYYGKLKGNVSKHLIRRHKNRKIYVIDLFHGTS
ncbi:zinc finger protein 813-like [Ooceraea biroi]|uniref:zinc finger protein 813-like n=1 Tax=Ooceraea biroi TaxID=2015173 RepID=UPI000F098D54|nr:zinc finger protein 813-like [Ooceraea biroi]